jgi:hypothetical protein
LRDSHVHHNTTRKIFETHSKLNLQDAMKLVSKQSLFDLYANNSEKMITPSKSLSALFRTYTQANLSSIQEDIPMKLGSLNLPIGSPAEFNFDLANLEYSPSHKDMADAEIHHILNDAMFTPIKRVSSKWSKQSSSFVSNLISILSSSSSIESTANPTCPISRPALVHLSSIKCACKFGI